MKKLFTSIMRSLGLVALPPITTRQDLLEFIESRAAYVSQVTLYTYVKARAGTQYPKLFENNDFLTSLRISRWHIYGAAVCDLSLFATAQFNRSGLLDDAASKDMANRLIDDIFAANTQDDIDPARFIDIANEGKRRVAFANWDVIAEGASAFKASSDAVYKWAPIADELKQDDEEIVRNSIHLRWIGVRRDLKETLRPNLIIENQ
ncbi:MAG: hypothetical protein VW987_04630 [Alphaproteobacteria bacterium]